MTRLRSIALGCLGALVLGGAASTAFAEEPGSFYNRLNGATVGLPLGAAAPPGLYTGLLTAYLGWPGSGSGNQGCAAPVGGHGSGVISGCLGFPAVAQGVPLLWSTGWNFLGASYSMAAVIAFYEVQVTGGGVPGLTSTSPPTYLGGVEAVANPLWEPINLSWNLKNGWFVSLGFDFMAPIVGTHYVGTTNPDYWTFEPTFAISYLANNWVISANFFYDINTASQGLCCGLGNTAQTGPGNGFVSGNILDIDMMAAYKFGKWEVGPVAYIEEQTTDDSPGAGVSCAYLLAHYGAACGKAQNIAVGGLVGYDFGPVDLQIWVTDSVYRDNQIDGLDIWTRLGFRLWAPEAPKPLVAKN